MAAAGAAPRCLGAPVVIETAFLGERTGMQVERGEVDVNSGRSSYYVLWKPDLGEGQVGSRFEVDVAISISETGELADVSFELPRKLRNQKALEFLSQEGEAKLVNTRVFIAIPGLSGDAVFRVLAHLEVDHAGRIVGLDIE